MGLKKHPTDQILKQLGWDDPSPANSDELDFKEFARWTIRDALRKAFGMGYLYGLDNDNEDEP